MNPYELLKAHVAKHRYTRGMNKGDAPLNPRRRRRDHERVSNRGDCMVVRRYSTDVVTAYPDGRVVIDCCGWASSTTTRVCVTEALYLMDVLVSLGSMRYRNLTQYALSMRDGQYAYYDGITLKRDERERWAVQEPRVFRAKVRDTERVGVWDEAVKFSGFKELFPILHMNAEMEHRPRGYWDPHHMTELLSSTEGAEDWLSVVAAFKWDSKYKYTPGGATREWFAYTRQETWTKLRSTLTKGMTKTIDTTDICF